MTPGKLARRLLGDRGFRVAGRLYRRLAVDLGAVADGIPRLEEGAHVLEVGGGDGDFLNMLLELNPGAHATLIDLAPAVGGWLSDDLRDRVEVLPSTSVAAYARGARETLDMVILSDVIHHVPVSERKRLLLDIRDLLGGRSTKLVVKDVEPGTFRARLLYLADRYVSGDPNVAFVRRDDMRRLVQDVFEDAGCEESDLFRRNPPNYCLVFSIEGTTAGS